MENLPENLRRLREMLGLTQDELAKLSGMNSAQISNYELGKRKPQYEAIRSLASALGVTTDELIGHKIKSSDFTPTPEELRILKAYRKAPDEFKDGVKGLLRNYMPVEVEKRGIS